MIVYIPTSGSDTAKRLSEALWSLSRPPQVRLPGEVTTAMFGSITCTDSSVWLAVDTTFAIPVHAEADLDGIADVLQPWIDEGSLPSNTNTQLADLIASLRGQRLTV